MKRSAPLLLYSSKIPYVVPSVQAFHPLVEVTYEIDVYVVHQQDRLLSCQLRPTFPPAWKE